MLNTLPTISPCVMPKLHPSTARSNLPNKVWGAFALH
jgi:hypothetical protein